MKTAVHLFRVILLCTGFAGLNTAWSQTIVETVGSGAWHNPAVWSCNCVPSASDDVVINPFNFVIIDSSVHTHSLEINPDGELIMNANSELHLSGDLYIIGKLTANGGNVILDGYDLQLVDGGGQQVTFYDLTINNQNYYPVSFYLSQYELKNVLYPIKGGMIIEEEAGNSFTFLSSDTHTARIDKVENYFNFIGNFSVQRYVPAGVAGACDLSSPVSNATFSMWDETVDLYGSSLPDGCSPWNEACDNALKYYEADQYIDITSVTDTLEVGRGYEVTLADDATTFNGATLTLTGSLNENNEITVNVSSLWDTKGNPYVSPIDFKKIARSGVTNYFYVYSAETGSYEWYDGVSNTTSSPWLQDGIIASGQAFYVNGPGTMTFTDTCKSDVGATFMKSTGETANAFYVTLSENGTNLSCTMSLQAMQGTTDAYDHQSDIVHLMTGKAKASSIGVTADGMVLRKNFFGADTDEKVFSVFTRIKREGYYTISLSAFADFFAYDNVVLVDHETGSRVNLKKQAYTFFSGIGDYERFSIELNNFTLDSQAQVSGIGENNNDFSITQYDGQLLVLNSGSEQTASVSIFDMGGHVTVLKREASLLPGTTTFDLPERMTGVQVVVIETNNGRVTQKIVL